MIEKRGGIAISIHASEKEATNPRHLIRYQRQISIHASEKEATQQISATQTRRGKISIHASEKEATKRNRQSRLPGQFQSTPPRRRRLQRMRLYFLFWDFNPRLREGGDSR